MALTGTKLSKTHRTVLFVDGSRLQSDSNYRNRVLRLGESLNGGNIKVDVFTVLPGASAPTGGIVAGIVTDAPKTSVSFDVAELHALGKENGYTQVLVSS